MWCTNEVKYCSALSRKTILMHLTSWMSLANSILLWKKPGRAEQLLADFIHKGPVVARFTERGSGIVIVRKPG